MLECKLCGKLINRSVKELMEHLILEHYDEFVDACERIFYNYF
jgi:transcription elongation factor Elf1